MIPEYFAPPIIFVVGAFVIAIAFVIRRHWQQERVMELEAWANKAGFNFFPERDDLFPDHLPDLKCFNQGHDQFVENISSGAWKGYGINAFDYHFTTGYGRNKLEQYFSAVVIGAPTRLKPLIIRPAELLDKLGEVVGIDDIHFESGEFNQKYVVKAQDRKWAYDVLHPRAMELLLQSAPFAFEFTTRSVAVHRNHRFKPEEFSQAVAVGVGLLELLPNYLMQQDVSGGGAA